MSDYRLGDETPPVARRPSRVYEEGGVWFFTTREGKPMGPFNSEADAQEGLKDFIEFIQLASLDTLASLTSALTPEGNGSSEESPR